MTVVQDSEYAERDLVGEQDEEIVEMRDPEPRDDKADSRRNASPLMSMFGEVSIFRDFFLAAFSDGYNSVSCCSEEGFFPGSGGSSGNGNFVSSRNVVPEDSVSRTSSYSPSLVKTPSHEEKRKRRKKPLAVAVGFNYANDFNGRPIVITPGRRSPLSSGGRSPSDPTGANVKHPLDLNRSRSDRSGIPRGSTPPKMPELPSSTMGERRDSPVSLPYRSQVSSSSQPDTQSSQS